MFGTTAQSYKKNNTILHLLSSFLGISINIFLKTFSQTFAETSQKDNFFLTIFNKAHFR